MANSLFQKLLLFTFLLLVSFEGFTQVFDPLRQQEWVDSVFQSLTDEQRIAQLMVVRVSERSGGGVAFYDKKVEEDIVRYNIGAVCLFQGNPVRQAQVINRFQQVARTPVMVCIDGETGVGMRFDSVGKFPDQLTMGALQDGEIVYKVGAAIGDQCRRIGIHVNYAPVVDINNNPNNPVINFRSFGEDKYKVSLFGTRIMKGMQDEGVMACAKHFPGHGDVSVDSHLDLPVINKTRAELDSLELYPFRELFKAGVGSVMMAHLYIPAIDATANRATSISYKNVTTLLRSELGYRGLSFTDALEMQGVKKFFPAGEASVESLIAGNDMLCLPGDVAVSISRIKEAIAAKRLTWEDIYEKVKRVLKAKYQYVAPNAGNIDLQGLTEDLNRDVLPLRRAVAENALTLLRNKDAGLFPLHGWQHKKTAYIAIGVPEENEFARRMQQDHNATVYYLDYRDNAVKMNEILKAVRGGYDVIIAGVHNYKKYPAGNFGLSTAALRLLKQVEAMPNSITLYFGNPYAAANSCQARNLMLCYEDDEVFQNAAADMLAGFILPKGKLPVTICDAFKFGSGIVKTRYLSTVDPAIVRLDENVLVKIDSIAKDAIVKKATPGCVVLVAKDGYIAYEKAFGNYANDIKVPVTAESIYDLASLTKVFATTLAVMKLYDEGKIKLDATLGDYLPWIRGSDKQDLLIKDVLLHQAGLVAFIPFYRETINPKSKLPYYTIYSEKPVYSHSIRVAENMYIRNDWEDTLLKRIVESPLGPRGKYVYSDNDFILLGKIVEALTGTTLDKYVKQEFYDKLGLLTTGFKPRERFPLSIIVPTERELGFRMQLLRGDVHDPGAAMFGEVAGHAGLFSDAYDLAVLSQMLLNGGRMQGRQFIKKETIDLFTAYQSSISRRGYGFDKPDPDPSRKEPYPCASASPLTYGHTGFTGTCVWIDPAYDMVYIFLSNRVNSYGGNKLGSMDVRGKIQEEIYKAMNFRDL